MISAVAGTFDVLHDGHVQLIRRAFEVGDSVVVGITSDEMASSTRRDIVPLYLRQKALEQFLSTMGKPWRVAVIDDMYGPADVMDPVDVLVVSEETVENGRKVNEYRRSRGVKPLELSVVPLVMAEDGSKISAGAILEGRYSRDGTSAAKDIAVGSLNHVKVEAVRTVMERIFGNVRITAVDVSSEVPPQPFEEQTRQGAVNRARNALGGHEMAVGIEAGVFEKEDGLYDFQYCAVLDRDGRLTVGTGSGFMYPPEVAGYVRGGMTVGDAVKKVFGSTDIGKKQGAVGLLSGGLLDRKSLTEQSVTAAMIPRLNDSYVARDRDRFRLRLPYGRIEDKGPRREAAGAGGRGGRGTGGPYGRRGRHIPHRIRYEDRYVRRFRTIWGICPVHGKDGQGHRRWEGFPRVFRKGTALRHRPSAQRIHTQEGIRIGTFRDRGGVGDAGRGGEGVLLSRGSDGAQRFPRREHSH